MSIMRKGLKNQKSNNVHISVLIEHVDNLRKNNYTSQTVRNIMVLPQHMGVDSISP